MKIENSKTDLQINKCFINTSTGFKTLTSDELSGSNLEIYNSFFARFDAKYVINNVEFVEITHFAENVNPELPFEDLDYNELSLEDKTLIDNFKKLIS